MADHHRHPTVWGRPRGSVVRSYNIARKGRESNGIQELAWLTKLDYLRRRANTSRGAALAPRPSIRASKGVCDRTATYPNSALCVFGYPGDTDDWLEGCGPNGRISPREHTR